MSLRVHATRSIVAVKALRYTDQSITDGRTPDGNNMRVFVQSPVMIEFKAGQHEYTDADVQNAGEKDTIESVLKWPTVKALVRKGIIFPVRDIEIEDDEVAPKKSTKKAITFGEE